MMMKWLCRPLLAGAALLSAVIASAQVEAPGATKAVVDSPLHHRDHARRWDPTLARGQTATIDFWTDEGTWMSVDISPDGQTLAFDLLGHIYTVSAAGGEARSLTQSSGVALNYHPVFSPDGHTLAFVSDRQGQDALWLMDADGSNPRPLFFDPDSRFAEPRWMPDGRAIVVTRRMSTHFGIYRPNDTLWIVPLDGAPPRRLTPEDPPITPPDSEFSGMPRWQAPSPSPDGRYVYFNSATFMGGNRQIMRADLKLGRIQSVTSSKTRHGNSGRAAQPLLLGETAPVVSPDGKALAFVRKLPGAKLRYDEHELTGRSALWLRDLTTGAERILMDPVEYDQMLDLPMWKARAYPGFSWSADGKSIFLSQGGKLRCLDVATGKVATIPFRARIHRVISQQARATAGKSILSATFNPHYVRNPALSPDGRIAALEAGGRIWLKPLRGGSAKPLLRSADDSATDLMPAWSPDGRQIAYVTSDGYGQGDLWIVSSDGAKPARKLTAASGDYIYPFWSPDGRSLFVSRWPAGLTREGDLGWELWRFDASSTSDGQFIAATKDPVDNGFRSDGRIYFTRSVPVQGSRPGSAELQSITTDGADLRRHLRVRGTAERIVPSADLKRAAIQQFQDIWVAPLPSDAEVDVLQPSTSVRRISEHGGTDPVWFGDQVLYASAGKLSAASVVSSRRASIPLTLQLRRAVAQGKLGIKGARIVTLGPAGTIEQGDLVVENGRISCVGSCDLSGMRRILDAKGTTITPGFIDVHSHSTLGDPYFIPLRRPESAMYLAYGVTTVHDPSSTPYPSFVLHDLIESGRIVGPRTYSAGHIHMSRQRGFEMLHPILGMDDARNEVARLAAQGVRSLKDFKIASRVQRQMYAEAAREKGLTVTSEGSEFPYTLGQIMDGVAGWEHPMQFAPMYGDLIRFLAAAGAHYSNQFETVGYPNGTSIEYFQAEANLWEDAKVRTWMPWQNVASRRIFGRKPLEEYSFPIVARDVGKLIRAGGYAPLGGHGEMHGLGMHWEIEALSLGAGPEAALRAASLHGAHFLGLDDQLGSLEMGKAADLLFLDGNPLEDIRNTQKIRWVMKAGVLRDALTLAEIWPRPRPYGGKPWLNAEIYRQDSRKLDHWDAD